jgi:hypothetical protein
MPAVPTDSDALTDAPLPDTVPQRVDDTGDFTAGNARVRNSRLSWRPLWMIEFPLENLLSAQADFA